MKFVSDHLHTEHFLKRPHKWSLALFLSPLHLAELHYKKRYHLTFVHAKKLFLFDLLLLLTIALLGVLSYIWFTYDPTVTTLVDLSITSDVHDPRNTDGRIRSGEHVTYTATYQNNSDVTLTESTLTFLLPPGFAIDEGVRTLELGQLAPKEEGEATISGFFYEPVSAEHHISAVLTYSQEHRRFTEQKQATIIQTLRGSILTGAIKMTEAILPQGSYPIEITLTNDNHHPIEKVSLPLRLSDQFTISEPRVEVGSLSENAWTVGPLDPGTEVTLFGTVTADISGQESAVTLSVIPALVVASSSIGQVPIVHDLTILRPGATALSSWQDDTPVAAGNTKNISVTVKNTGTTDLTSLDLSFPIPDVVDAGRLVQSNGGSLSLNTYTKKNIATRLSPGEETTLSLSIPIKSWNAGTNLVLSLEPKIHAIVPEVPNGIYTVAASRTSEIAIGTNLILTAESRYYTDEGDQLGRGPLPARVGQETKYWAFISLRNTSSELDEISFSAQLPANVAWTDKYSVSQGAGLVYNPATKTVTYRVSRMAPQATIGLFMELALTPTAAQQGSSPLLLQNITASGIDTFIEDGLTRYINGIDISLPSDDIGRAKGTTVQ